MEGGFPNRAEAGRLLGLKLSKYAGRDDVIVLGLPRSGVPVAYEVAQALRVPLDVFIVRKLGVPGFEELAVGAIASGGVRVLNEDVARALPNADEIIEDVTAKEMAEVERREQSYRDGRPAPELRDRVAILVDDGLATGATMRAAVKALRQRGAAKIVVAVPVGPPDTCREFEDEAIDLHTREHRFNISLLAERLVHATKWATQQQQTRDLRIGYFGSSTGGAAALVGAAELPKDVGAVVSRGGRPDLADGALSK